MEVEGKTGLRNRRAMKQWAKCRIARDLKAGVETIEGSHAGTLCF
jgi:hypothetical protein